MRKNYAFILIELIVVIAIIGILAAIAVPRLGGYKDLAESRVCGYNIRQLEREFELFVLDHSDQPKTSLSTDFLFKYELDHEICPSGGVISYSGENGFECGNHNVINEDNPQDGEVPWL